MINSRSIAVPRLYLRLMIKNPVMFVVEIVAALTTVTFLRDLPTGGEHLGFTFQIILWLWFSVLFANLAEAVAEDRGKAQAESLRKTAPPEDRSRSGAAAICADGDRDRIPAEGGGLASRVDHG